MMVSGFYLLGFSMAGEVNLTSIVISEFCPPTKRHVLTLLSLFFSFEAILASSVALLVEIFNQSGMNSLRLIIACLCGLQFAVLVTRMWIEETSVYLFEAKKADEAEEILNHILKLNIGKVFSFEDFKSEREKIIKEKNKSKVPKMKKK